MSYTPTKAEEQAGLDPGEAFLPCHYCGLATKRKVLAHLGARCESCYAMYCAKANPRAIQTRQPASISERIRGLVEAKRVP